MPHLATVITPRLGVPLLLVFLVIGLLAGEDGPGNIHFSDYPLANLAHLLGIALLVGAIVALDLRLLGFWPEVPLAAVARATVPVAGRPAAAGESFCLSGAASCRRWE